MLMKKIVALRNKQTKPAELVFFESMVKDNSVLRMTLKYIYDSTSLTEAVYHVWLVNETLKSLKIIGYEVIFKVEQEVDHGPVVYKVILLYDNRIVANLFELDI